MPEVLKERIREVFAREVERTTNPFSYRLGLFLVTIVMIILPLLYVGIIAGASWGLYYHVEHHQDWLDVEGNLRSYPYSTRRTSYGFILYAAPILVGGTLVLFMVTPLIPRFSKRARPLYTITRENEPVFYDYIEQICRSVYTPMPREIQLIMEPNAFAGFRRGFLSFFIPNDLTLAIGLPLINSLSVQKLSGIIAHEMGHFTQGTGMRLSYIISSIHRWFYRAVYEPNIVQDKLMEMVEDNDRKPAGVAIILLCSMLFIGLTKLVLMALMSIGYLVSNFLSRRMEYDADCYEVQVAGSRAFESAMYSLLMLNKAFGDAFLMSRAVYRKGMLCEDMPALVKFRAKLYARKKKEDFINETLVDDTRLLDTHPSARDRIAHARRLNQKGICQIREPVSDLFRDFKALSANLSRSFYLINLDADLVTQSRLLSVQEFLECFELERIDQRVCLVEIL